MLFKAILLLFYTYDKLTPILGLLNGKLFCKFRLDLILIKNINS